MLLLGTSLAGAKCSVTPTLAERLRTFILSHGEWDDIYVSRNVRKGFVCDGRPDEWDYDTVFWAQFKGNLVSSNISPEMLNCEFLRVKRRIKNTFNWITLFEVDPTTDPDGWEFFRYDKTARAHTDYDYAIVPVVGGIEGNMSVTSVYSCFEGVYLFDPGEDGESYYSLAEYSNPVTRNKEVDVYTTLGSKYPFSVSNGMANYDSGTMSALFVDYDWDYKEFNYERNPQLREKIMKFLTNGNEKLMKMGNGRIWLMVPTSSIEENTFQDMDLDTIGMLTFDWIENANAESGHDLYMHGFIECDLDDYIIQ